MCVPRGVHQCVNTCIMCVNSWVCDMCSCVLANSLVIVHVALDFYPLGFKSQFSHF